MWYAIVAILILIADQGLKYWVTLNIPLDTGHVTLIPGVLELTNIHNNGAAFSILQHAPHWIFVLFTLVFAAIAVFCLRRNVVHGKVGRWSVVLVLAGAVGNCIDRILSGYVVDMFNFLFVRFAVFNLADIFIVVAGIALCLHVIFYRVTAARASPRRNRRASPASIRTPPSVRTSCTCPLGSSPSSRPPHRKCPLPRSQRPAPAKDDPFAAWDRAPVQAQPGPGSAGSAEGPGSTRRTGAGADRAQGGRARRQTGGCGPGGSPARPISTARPPRRSSRKPRPRTRTPPRQTARATRSTIF